jgi:hypothetical protein
LARGIIGLRGGEAMPLCPYCHTVVGEDNRFCPECGRLLAVGGAVKGKSKKKLAGIIIGCTVVIIVAIALIIFPPWRPLISPLEERLSSVSNVILPIGSYTTLPSNGIYLQAGQLVTVSWSADFDLDIYLFTETEFDNFKPYLIPSGYENYFSGKGATFSTYITNNATYYVVIAHGPESSQSTIKLYQATITSQWVTTNG